MIQRIGVSLVDVAYIPDVVLSTTRFEEVGDSGPAGLVMILAQHDRAGEQAVQSASAILADQWLRRNYAKDIPDAYDDAGTHDHPTEFIAKDDRLATTGFVERPRRHGMIQDRPVETPGRVGQTPNRTGAVRADAGVPAARPRRNAAATATQTRSAVQSLPDEDDDVHAIVFVASSGNLAAEARFWQDGSNLMIQLTNTSPADPATVTEVLTALFFNIAGQPTLTPVSVVMATGSKILYPITQPADGKTVSFEWAYRAGDVKSPGSMEYGVSVAAFNAIFKPTDRFPGDSLHGNGNNMSDVSFGLVGPGKTNTGSKTMTGNLPFIQDSVIFMLAGLPDTFDLLTDIDHVWFQYGTSLSDPSLESFRIIQRWEEELINPPDVPEPTTLTLLTLGTICLLRRR